MNIIKITRFSEKVFKAVLKLLPQLSTNVVLPSKQYFKDILKSENTHFFIAELENNEIAGMLTIVTYNIPSGSKVWIEDVVVDESQRGRGIGRELMLYVINYSKSLGADTIQLTSRPSRVAANELYRNIGFRQYETNVYKYELKAG